MRLGERRGVVDAVAGHGHDVALGLQALDHLAFLIGQDLGLDLVEIQLAPDGLGRGAVVAGQHDDPHPVGVQQADRLGRGFLDRVGNAD